MHHAEARERARRRCTNLESGRDRNGKREQKQWAIDGRTDARKWRKSCESGASLERRKTVRRRASRYRGRQLSRLGGDDVRCPTTARSDVFSPRRNIKSPLVGYLRIKYGLKRIDMQGVDMGVLTECLVVLHLEERVFYRKLKQRKRSVR